jgi:hypothetical protein
MDNFFKTTLKGFRKILKVSLNVVLLLIGIAGILALSILIVLPVMAVVDYDYTPWILLSYLPVLVMIAYIMGED